MSESDEEELRLALQRDASEIAKAMVRSMVEDEDLLNPSTRTQGLVDSVEADLLRGLDPDGKTVVSLSLGELQIRAARVTSVVTILASMTASLIRAHQDAGFDLSLDVLASTYDALLDMEQDP